MSPASSAAQSPPAFSYCSLLDMGHIIHLETVDSTSDYLRENKDKLDGFSFVYCDFQRAGHGRNGRSWVSEKGTSIAFSFLIKDQTILSYGPKITLPIAYVVSKAIEELGIEGTMIKWPNDIYIHGKKAVGILLEGSLPDYLIVGIGINANQEEFHGQFRVPPTSLKKELGHPIDIESFQRKLFAALEDSLLHLETSFPESYAYFETHDFLFGKKVSLEGEKGYHCHGIDQEFALLLEKDGEIKHNKAGEIILDE